MRKGITYDTGFLNLGADTYEHFDPADVFADMRAIAEDLGCEAVRVTGGHPHRLEQAARAAADHGLEVWFSPFTCDLGPEEMLELLADCADRAERLRLEGARVTLTTGAEISLFNKGFIPGDTCMDRIDAMMAPGGMAALIPALPAAVNAFLAQAVAVVRERFAGPVSYAAIHFEGVDWEPFDLIGYDLYRMDAIADRFPAAVAALAAQGKPLAVTETGSATWKGASTAGAQGGMIVKSEGGEITRIDGDYVRDEAEQAATITDLLDVFAGAGADIAFVCTFASRHLPHDPDGGNDLDLAGYGVVKVGPDRRGWTPKEAFGALAAYPSSTGTSR